jgi:integrase
MKGGRYYCKWSDARGHPQTPKKTESLKTDKKKIAFQRMTKLEDLYNRNKHDPWITPWYRNPQIQPLIFGNVFDQTVDIGNISVPQQKYIPYIYEAAEHYISYKTPEGDTKTEAHQWSPQTNAPKMKTQIRSFASIIGPKKLTAITEKDYQHIIEAKNLHSDHSIANVAIKWNAFFQYCQQQKWITRVPKVAVPKPQAHIPVFIYNDDLYKMCRLKIQKVQHQIDAGYTKAENSQKYMPLGWLLIRYTGMRPIELQHLRLDGIDLTHREITIGKSKRTKTAIQRKVGMNEIVYEICKLAADDSFRSQDRWMRQSDHIFGRPGNQSKRRLSEAFTTARKKILPERDEVTLYTLRDTFAVGRLANPEGNSNPLFEMKNIRDAMGHASISTTEKYWKAVPNRYHFQRLHNSKIFCKILKKFY